MKENLYSAHKQSEEYLREQQLLIEYHNLKSYSPSGIYTIPSINNINIWQGVIFIRQGYYKDGIFRFKIEIPYDYPNTIPLLYFNDYVYHPLIDPITGQLSLSPQFPIWRPGKDFIFSLLGYMKKIFYSKDLWTCIPFLLNPKALATLAENEFIFIAEVRSCVQQSQKFEENKVNGGINFSKFNSLHFTLLQNLKKNIQRPTEFLEYFRENFI